MGEGAGAESTRGHVVGRYALYDEIGAGGMAAVHLGRLLGHVGFTRTVAIKRLRPEFAKDPEFITMLLDEARVTSRIQHPNVVPTLDVVNTDGELFIVMDYVHGESLARLIRLTAERLEQVPPRIAVALTCGILYGLHAAHEAKNREGEPLGIIHRDVSPQNVLVGADGVARLLDFGIAKALGRMHMTRDGMIKGKPSYMAPEQIRGRPTQSTDVYAASVVLWELLTGKRLFAAENDRLTIESVLLQPVVAPSESAEQVLDAGVVARLDAIVLRGLAREQRDRFANAREMALALEVCLPPASPAEVGDWVERVAGTRLTERAQLVASMERAEIAPPRATEARPAEPPRIRLRSSKRKGAVLGAAAALAIAAALLASKVRTRAAPAEPPHAPSVPLPTEMSPRVTEEAPAPSTVDSSPPRATKPRVPAAAPAPSRANARHACDPPFTLDEAGRKIFKEECLR